MTRAKKRRRAKRVFAPSWKASVVARVLRGRVNRTETQRQIAVDVGVSEGLVSRWVQLLGKKVASGSAGSANGSANGSAAPDTTPSIELKGLRAWVNHAVRVEVDRVLAEKKLGGAKKGRP